MWMSSGWISSGWMSSGWMSSGWMSSGPRRRRDLAHPRRLPMLGIAARSAAVSAMVVLVALTFSGAGLDLMLYRSLLAGVDDAAAGRVRDIVDALHSDGPDN